MKSAVVLLTLAAWLAAGCQPSSQEATKPTAAAASSAESTAPAYSTPPDLAGRYFALTMNAMRAMGDIEFANGRFTSTAGSIPIDLKTHVLPGYGGKAWLARLDERSHAVLPFGNRFCAGPDQPDRAQWLLVTLDIPAEQHRAVGPLIVSAYDSEAPPVRPEQGDGLCGVMVFDRLAPGRPLTQPIGSAEIISDEPL